MIIIIYVGNDNYFVVDYALVWHVVHNGWNAVDHNISLYQLIVVLIDPEVHQHNT